MSPHFLLIYSHIPFPFLSPFFYYSFMKSFVRHKQSVISHLKTGYSSVMRRSPQMSYADSFPLPEMDLALPLRYSAHLSSQWYPLDAGSCAYGLCAFEFSEVLAVCWFISIFSFAHIFSVNAWNWVLSAGTSLVSKKAPLSSFHPHVEKCVLSLLDRRYLFHPAHWDS